jgi:hypothetical protein
MVEPGMENGCCMQVVKRHVVKAAEFHGFNMSRESMYEIVRVILAGRQTMGKPHYDPPVPFASFRDIAVALGLEPEEIGECLALNRNLHDFKFENYYDVPRGALGRIAGIALIQWPAEITIPKDKPQKDEAPVTLASPVPATVVPTRRTATVRLLQRRR